MAASERTGTRFRSGGRPPVPGPTALDGETGARRTLQLPTRSELRVASKQRTLLGIGGDFFEVFQHGDGSVSTVMADVSGNGPTAATPVNDVRWALRQHLARGESPAAVLAAVNDWLAEQRTHDHFVTAVCVRIDVRSGRADVASAGHLGPFVKRAGGSAESVAPGTGLALGILPGQIYAERALELRGTDAVVLVTDGVSDSYASGGDWLGERGLLARLTAAPPGSVTICDALLGAEAPHGQDATVVVLEMPARGRRGKGGARGAGR
jgi:serine phosphatase RsbU (regulator of sigma subunit)